ncbi:NAD(P)/FAD-dependent oxidoreductase, partial [Pseudonocardia sulfidoxydans]
DAAALHAAYVRGLRRRGGQVRTSARVTGIDRLADGWRVHVGGSTTDVPDVVDAAGAWADVVARAAGVAPIGLTPLRRTAAVLSVAEPERLAGVDGGLQAMVTEVGERFYFKSESGGLLASPGDETPSDPVDARPDALDVALALERVAAVTTLGLRSVRTSWAGLRSFVADRRPVVGARPRDPGFHFVAGQGGSGIETSPALGALAAAVVTGTPVPSDIDLDPGELSPSRLK